MVDTFVARRGSPVAAAHSGQAPKQPSPRQRRIQKNKERHLVKQQERRQQQDQAPLPETAAAAAAPPQPPPGRPALGCPHFASCSGCTLEQDLDRPQLLEEAHAFFAEQCAFSGFRLTAGSVHGWRRRARLAVRRSSSGGQAEIGLFEEGSHTVVPIPSCVVHHPAINAAVQLLQQALTRCGIQPYDEAAGEGELRYVQLTVVEGGAHPSSSVASDDVEGSTEEVAAGAGAAVELVLVWNAAGVSGRLQALADHLWQLHGAEAATPLLHSVWANCQPARTNTILGRDWQLLHGAEWAWARLGGADVCFGPGSFMQANFGAMDAALAAMQQHVPAGSTIVDLHAGVGTIGLSLAATRQPRWVRFVEINGQGLPPFQRSAARLSSSDGDGAALEYHVAAAGSDPGRWCAGAKVVVLDPPRKGLEPELLAWLCSPAAPAAGVRRLLYLSCGFAALRRDAAAVLGSGRWRLAHAEGFLFFPGANHIETLAVFEPL